jgi:cytochrome P450
VSGGFRGVVKGFEFDDYYIPEGYQVLYSIRRTHRDRSAWDDPDSFRPERFDDGRPVPFSLIGFGGGARICVGYAFAQLEMKIIASHLLRGYEWELLNPDVEMKYIPTQHPVDGLEVRFRRR